MLRIGGFRFRASASRRRTSTVVTGDADALRFHFTRPIRARVDRDARDYRRPDLSEERREGFIAAQTELEQRLVGIWERVLDLRPIGIRDDFFELGVSSIVAAQLFAQTEHELGRKLPLGAVCQAPTIESLAALLERRQWTSLVPIQPQGTKLPIFCVHGGAGTILHLQPLARCLGPDQPFYGLQSPGLYGGAPPLKTVEEMSSHYLAELKTVQPSGPYHLAGYCFGAIVAFDMAQILRRNGEDVRLLAMFNGPSPAWIRQWGFFGNQPSQRRKRANTQSDARALPMHSKIVRVLRDPERRRRWRHYLAFRARRFVARRVTYRWLRVRARAGLSVPEHRRGQYFLLLHSFAERAYKPKVYDGEILMFSGAGMYEDPELGWAGLAKDGVHVHPIPGEHNNNRALLDKPYASQVAETLRWYLETRERYGIRLSA